MSSAVGITLTEATYDNNMAILLGDGQRIGVGAGPGGTRYLEFNATSSLLNASNMSYAVNGQQVMGARSTGWAATTGATDKTTFATYTAPTISNPPTQAEVQALANATQTNSRHLAALINVGINQGWIGA